MRLSEVARWLGLGPDDAYGNPHAEGNGGETAGVLRLVLLSSLLSSVGVIAGLATSNEWLTIFAACQGVLSLTAGYRLAGPLEESHESQ